MHSRFFFIPIGHALKIFGFSSLLIMPSLTAAAGTEAAKLAEQYACTACHGADRSVVGPAFRDIAKKYAGNKNAAAELVAKVRVGGSGVWGQVPMPPNAHVPEADVQKIVAWVLAGAPAE
ncbi:cytochrome c [Fontimonas thermophila]|uniref:Cytochrome c-551 n=2 Tax=Fontimonas thermophila TaxID=1076937 RepID=A0A1I2IZC2_9GAMM|nr:cytochrome c [Fontimonas thermophila]